MEMQRGPRGLRDREYPEDVQGHVDAVADEPAEQPAEQPAAETDEDDVQGHRMVQAFGEERDGRER